MQIRVEQYDGSVVNNTSAIQFVKLVDPPISVFDKYNLSGETAAYEATVGEEVTYSYFTIDYNNTGLMWSGLRFHKLSDDEWVTKLTEDQFIVNNWYYTNVNNTTKLKIPTFGSDDSNQIDMSNVDNFNISYLYVYEEAFCSVEDIKLLLRSNLKGRLSIGETNQTAGNENLVTLVEIYTMIRDSWAMLTMNLAKRYNIPIRLSNSAAQRVMADVSAKDVCNKLYVMFYPTAKFGDVPNIITSWRNEVNKFIKNIGKIPLDGAQNKLEQSGGVYEFERG